MVAAPHPRRGGHGWRLSRPAGRFLVETWWNRVRADLSVPAPLSSWGRAYIARVAARSRAAGSLMPASYIGSI